LYFVEHCHSRQHTALRSWTKLPESFSAEVEVAYQAGTGAAVLSGAGVETFYQFDFAAMTQVDGLSCLWTSRHCI
jgi:hypothetical protein